MPDEARPSTTSPGAILRAVDDLRFFHGADGEAGQVVFAVRVHARHFGGFAADQGAAGLFAAGGDALDDGGGGRHVQLAAGKIVEEEQRLGALHQDVVDAHRDQVDADRVMTVQLESQLELGADAVGTGDQHGLLELLADLEQRAETADTAEHAFAHGALGKGLDRFDQGVAGIDIDTGVAVGERNIRWLAHGIWQRRR
jgi:hypothetical protein